MRHIITGGSGFTGSVLTRSLLKKGEMVVNIDIRAQKNLNLTEGVQFINGDIRDPATME